MSPFEPLIEEHRQIRIVVGSITSLIEIGRLSRRVSPAPFLDFQQFILRFADGSHHAKEEQVVFHEMVQAGIPSATGALEAVLHDHEQGRKYAAVIGAAARACLDGQWQRQLEMVEASRAWCQLVTWHTEREELMLFPIAERVIPAARLAEFPRLFAKADPDPASAFKDAADAVVEAVSRAAHRQRPTG